MTAVSGDSCSGGGYTNEVDAVGERGRWDRAEGVVDLPGGAAGKQNIVWIGGGKVVGINVIDRRIVRLLGRDNRVCHCGDKR